MTTLTASLHHPPAGTCRSRRRTTAAPVPANPHARPPTVAESHRPVRRQQPILNDGRQSTPNDDAEPSPR